VLLKLFSKFLLVDLNAAKTLLQGLDSLETVTEGDSDIPEHGRVRQISLESGDG